MAKRRVHEIAKELGMESKELVPQLQAMGYEVKSHASSLEEEDAENALAEIREEKKANIVEKRVSGGVIRRRARAPAPKPPPAAVEEPGAEKEAAEKPARRRKSAKPSKEEAAAEATAEAKGKKTAAAKKTAKPAEGAPKAAKEKAKPAKKAAGEKSSFYQAKVIKRATPEESSAQQAKMTQTKTEPKPSGIRVLKVVPGRAGRGHQFIDMSKQTDGRRKSEVHSQQSKAYLRDQLFDAFTPGYLPGLSRRKRLARSKGGIRGISHFDRFKGLVSLSVIEGNEKRIEINQLANGVINRTDPSNPLSVTA